MKTWFTGDHHFGHQNIIAYCERPYASAAEMDADTIRRWNETISPDDLVYHLGDFAFGERGRWPSLLASLNGRKVICLGNHDQKPPYMMNHVGFQYAFYNKIVEVEGVRLWLHHYPLDNSDDKRRYARPEPPGKYDLALCGHVHEKWTVRAGCVNVGVDVWDFTPIPLSQILAAFESGDY